MPPEGTVSQQTDGKKQQDVDRIIRDAAPVKSVIGSHDRGVPLYLPDAFLKMALTEFEFEREQGRRQQ